MFLKLFKHEMKCSYRSFLILFAITFLVSLVINPNGESFIANFAILIYGISIVTILIMCVVVIVRNYHISMFSRNSYLTHTLPVSSTMLLITKTLSALLWAAISYIFIFLTIMIIGMRFSEFTISDVFSALGTLDLGLESMLFLLYLCISYISTILLIYFVMNLTHTTYIQRHRVAIAVIVYLLISFIESFIAETILAPSIGSSFASGIFGISMVSSTTYMGDIAFATNGITMAFTCMILFEVALSTLYFFFSKYLLDHKLEIE